MIEPHAVEEKGRIAVLPIENLSGTSAPLKEIRQSLIHQLKTRGLDTLDENALERFMERHRVRYTGGMDATVAQAFREETGAGAVLITTLELYSAVRPPKIALTARLVSTGDKPFILWMDSIGLAGDDSPGILGLGLIDDPRALAEKALGYLSSSLRGYLSGRGERSDLASVERRFRPKVAYRPPIIKPGKKYTVALIPFLNQSTRKNAGEIMALHFARELAKTKKIDVIEPGVVRQQLLAYRIIMSEGISAAQVDLILGGLDADLILTGEVLDYQDYEADWGKPKVDFTALVIDAESRRTIWISKSHNEGDDGVFFFDLGRVNTAQGLASRMVRAVGERMVQ